MSLTGKWMELENILLRQTQKDKYRMFPHPKEKLKKDKSIWEEEGDGDRVMNIIKVYDPSV